ncbi:hypothetical protein Tsubulata_009653 [Turnera subulata]|uniref:PB1 domain-containing protein n=1 Tax=Turnera subulata TaxID=218843 RepID=A0A9Q0GGH9_9ROSI|nr:hypothetical protein Tsubulata_009653 [Turnera subulata]
MNQVLKHQPIHSPYSSWIHHLSRPSPRLPPSPPPSVAASLYRTNPPPLFMDPPPLPPLPTPSSAAASLHLNYPESVDSSPRSHTTNTFHEPLPLVPGSKLRLMCSYGGHIIPRPHDKSLTYVGGETRMVVIDRHSSLLSLTSRLSRTLLNGRPFTLKYQLPNEELDSLISVTVDEDLENMIEEYDRTRPIFTKSTTAPPSTRPPATSASSTSPTPGRQGRLEKTHLGGERRGVVAHELSMVFGVPLSCTP